MAFGTDSATAEFIRGHLDDDLEEVARQPHQRFLRPSLAPFLTADGQFHLSCLTAEAPAASLILQVMSVKDVSLSREQRCRAMIRASDLSSGGNALVSASSPTAAAAVADPEDAASVVDATLQAMEDQNDEAGQQQGPLRPSGGQWRCLRLELSDGYQRVLAVEDASARARQQHGGLFAADGIALGCKMMIRVAVPSASSSCLVQHGVLRVHAGNTEILGGRVRTLEVFWETQARQLLAASTGRPSKLPQQQQQQPSVPSLPAPGAPTPSASAPPRQQQHTSSDPPAAPPSSTSLSSQQTPVQPLRQWPAHVAHTPPNTPFTTIAFITEVVSDMMINEPAASTAHPHQTAAFTYALLAQLSSPNAVERATQQQQTSQGSATPSDGNADEVTEEDHLTVDLGHAWLRRLVGMPAEDFRLLSLSQEPADVARLTTTVEAVGMALEQFGKGRFTLAQRAGDGMVEVVKAEQLT